MTADAELLTVPEVMARLRISRSTVYALIRTGQLISTTIGRARHIPAHALDHLTTTRFEQEAACWPPPAPTPPPAPDRAGSAPTATGPSTSVKAARW